METMETRGTSKAARLVRTTLMHAAVSGMGAGAIVAGALMLAQAGYLSGQQVTGVARFALALIPYWVAVGSKVHADYIREVSEGQTLAAGKDGTRPCGMAPFTAQLVRRTLAHAAVSSIAVGVIVVVALALGQVG